MATVLIVDDEPWFLRLIGVLLTRAGYEVATASDGAEAFQKLVAAKPDLILLDVTMPYVDGFQVLETLKADPELQHIPIIMLTGRNQDEDITEGHRQGADLYLTKPIDREELLLAIDRLVSDRGECPGNPADELPANKG